MHSHRWIIAILVILLGLWCVTEVRAEPTSKMEMVGTGLIACPDVEKMIELIDLADQARGEDVLVSAVEGCATLRTTPPYLKIPVITTELAEYRTEHIAVTLVEVLFLNGDRRVAVKNWRIHTPYAEERES